MDKAYENLANAIVLSAVEDFRDSKKKLKKDFANTEAMALLFESFNFIGSAWYRSLTTVDPEIIKKTLWEE